MHSPHGVLWRRESERKSALAAAAAAAAAAVLDHCANRSTTPNATRRPTAPLDRDAANAEATTVGAVDAGVVVVAAAVVAEAVVTAGIGAAETEEQQVPVLKPSESVRCRDRLQTDCWARAPAPKPRRAATPRWPHWPQLQRR